VRPSVRVRKSLISSAAAVVPAARMCGRIGSCRDITKEFQMSNKHRQTSCVRRKIAGVGKDDSACHSAQLPTHISCYQKPLVVPRRLNPAISTHRGVCCGGASLINKYICSFVFTTTGNATGTMWSVEIRVMMYLYRPGSLEIWPTGGGTCRHWVLEGVCLVP
jgi:hypothetical protein